jgi:hypothetical protein
MHPNDTANQAQAFPNQIDCNSAQEAYENANEQWRLLADGPARGATIRALFTAIRLSVHKHMEDEDVTDIDWLAQMGAHLADIAHYEPPTC